MEISKNSLSKFRFDINGITEPKGKKTGIAGYHGGFWAIIGWIAAKILHKAVPIQTSKGVYYLNCKSLENWYRRLTPGSVQAERNKEFSKKMHDPDAVAKMIDSFTKAKPSMPKTVPVALPVSSPPQTPQDLWEKLSRKTEVLSIDYLPQNEDHRFTNVGCPRNTAIIVDNRSLHANQVTTGEGTRFHFIASQAPLKDTEHLFWQWISENDYSILDLTTLEDQDVLNNPVTRYSPENLNETYHSGDFQIKLIEKEGIRRKYQLVNTLTSHSKEVIRHHCTEWKDYSEGSLEILKRLVEVLENNPRMWVHCRAGIGRTGTLLTAALLKEKIQNGEITKENFDDSLVDLIASLREKRGHGLVQTLEQFTILHQYGMDLF
jgi:protein tyrosine phosphatase